jgi:hypothetical protein
MATTNATIAVNVTGQQQVDRLKKSISDTNDTFGRLKTAIAGLALGGFITQTFQLAASITDVANATGLGTDGVLGFTRAVAANGGAIDAAQVGLTKFAQNIEAALGGSKELQNTFLDLNISLEDLRTLSEQDLLTRVVNGLGTMEGTTKRLTTGISLFGKAFRTVDFPGLAQSLGQFNREAFATKDAIAAADEAEQNFTGSLFGLQVQLLQTLKPISELAASLLKVGTATKTVVQFLLDFALAAGAIALAVAALSPLGRIFTAIGTALAALFNIVKNILPLIRALLNPTTRSSLLKNLEELGSIGRFVKIVIDAMAGAVVKLGTLFTVVGAGIYASWNSIKGLFGSTGDAAKEMVDFVSPGLDRVAQSARDGKAALSEHTQALAKMTEAYRSNIAEAQRKYEIDTQLLGIGEDQRNIITELASAETAYRTEVLKLVEQYNDKLQAARDGSKIDEQQLPRIAQAIQDITNAYQEQIGTIDGLVEARNRAQTVENTRLFGIQKESEALSRLADIQYEIATVTLPAQEKKYRDITFQAQKSAEIAIREEQIRRGTLLTDAEKEKYRQKALESTQKLINKERELTAKSRDFNVGWRRAFNDYVDNATNAARRAEQIFGKLMSGMEDMLVNFAKTGEFNWKSFVNMMAEELLRSQIQSLFGSIMTGMQGLSQQGGILGSIAGLLGGGGGASTKGQTSANPMFVYDVAAGGNPIAQAAGNIFGQNKTGKSPTAGIFDTVTSGIGKAVSSVGSVLSNVGSGIFDTIGSIGSSIGDFFGGFFANGGTLGAGKWGIAGENGPEIISGPATVTPMGGGSNVTYNISAVDAASFQQLVARDPGFIYAVTEQGRRGLPGTRR